jgi:hypothetical protein
VKEMGTEEDRPHWSNFSFTLQAIEDEITELKQRAEAGEYTVFEDESFNNQNSTITGINGTHYHFKTFTWDASPSSISEYVFRILETWDHREMYLCVYPKVEVRLELYGGVYAKNKEG